MKKLFAMLVIGLGLAVGFSFGSDINACDDQGFAMEVRDTHIANDLCTEEHTICVECNGYFCDNLTCWCGEEIPNVVMTYDELMIFDEMIWDIYLNEYCTNECDKCETYYYEECMCESIANGCGSDCEVCIFYDYEIFVEDYYDMIIDEYYEILRGIIEAETNEEIEIIVCEF